MTKKEIERAEQIASVLDKFLRRCGSDFWEWHNECCCHFPLSLLAGQPLFEIRPDRLISGPFIWLLSRRGHDFWNAVNKVWLDEQVWKELV